MAELAQCPDCASWNPPQATRCRTCGRELRGPIGSFKGPPPDAPRPRTPAEEGEAEARRATALREALRASRAQKREEDRTRREYVERRERLRAEVAASPRIAPSEGRSKDPTAHETPDPSAATTPERIPTHVDGLDEALGGGIPTGYVIVLEGAPGTMKSSLGFWIVAHNSMDGRRALYVSAEEGTGSLLRQMRALGVDMDVAAKGVKVLEPRLLRKILKPKQGDWLTAFRGAVEEARREGGLDLLVIDSLEALEVLAGFRDRRQELFRLFEWLRDAGLTTFVVAERPDFLVQGNVLQGRYDEDFLADGVLTLRLHPISDQEVQRRLRIVKMRGTRHETGYLALHVGAGEFQVGRVLSA